MCEQFEIEELSVKIPTLLNLTSITHFISPHSSHRSKITIGEWDLTSDPDCRGGDCAYNTVSSSIEEAFVHPNYNQGSRFVNDIALLKLRRNVPFTSKI